MLWWYFQLSGSISDRSNKDSGIFGGTFSVYQSTRTRELLQQDVHKTRTAWLSGSHLGGWCIPAHLTTPRTVQEEVASMKMKKHLVDKVAGFIDVGQMTRL